jgi:hypothetical protein
MIPRTQRALEYIGMIDDLGDPTPIFARYIQASDEDAKAVLASAIQDSYSTILRAVDPATDDRTKVTNAFRMMKPSGQWGRMVTLFLGLCQAAGIPVKDPPSKRPGKDEPGAERSPSRPRTTVRNKIQASGSQVQGASFKPPAGIDPALAGMVSKLSEVETLDDLDRWWLAFRALFGFVKKIA